MMTRTQLSFEREMLGEARRRAADLGISLAEYVRRLVAADLGGDRPSVGPERNLQPRALAGVRYRPAQGFHDRQGLPGPVGLTLFVDTSVWYAAADVEDRSNDRAREILSAGDRLVTTDHVLVESWTLLRLRIHRAAAETFWDGLRSGIARIESVGYADLHAAWGIGRAFPHHDFSLVDRTSFAVMERLGVTRAASFDNNFAIYRFGPRRSRAFEVVR